MVKIKQGECYICKKFKAVDEDWMCGSCAAEAFVKGNSEPVAKSPACNDGLSCHECKSTSLAHFNLEFQDFTHRTMCHDCKEYADGMSFEATDLYFKAAR